MYISPLPYFVILLCNVCVVSSKVKITRILCNIIAKMSSPAGWVSLPLSTLALKILLRHWAVSNFHHGVSISSFALNDVTKNYLHVYFFSRRSRAPSVTALITTLLHGFLISQSTRSPRFKHLFTEAFVLSKTRLRLKYINTNVDSPMQN